MPGGHPPAKGVGEHRRQVESVEVAGDDDGGTVGPSALACRATMSSRVRAPIVSAVPAAGRAARSSGSSSS